MISERELLNAINECERHPNPNANTCLMLSSFYTILDHMRAEERGMDAGVSYAAGSISGVIDYDGNSEFADAVHGRQIREIMPVMEELMETIRVLNPSLYNGVMRRL